MIVERLLNIRGVRFHTLEDYSDNSTVLLGKNITKDEEAIQLIVDFLKESLFIERKI